MSTRIRQGVAAGAAANTRRSSQRVSTMDKGGTLRATTISFTNPATIADSGNGLAIFPVGALLQVEGSPRNSSQFRVTASAAGSLTVAPGVVTTEGAGASIRLRRAD
jgi:hypothetical protein